MSDFTALEDLEIGHTTSPLGSGGMRSKVVAAEMATAAGISTVICNGLSPDALRRCSSESATRAGGRARGHPVPGARGALLDFKLWLKYAKPSRGTLLIDAGAARAVREGSASLLPVGVVEVLGDFDAGDAVEIAERGSWRRAGTAARQGDLQLLRAGAAAGARLKSAAVQADPAARHRGGRAPRLPGGRLTAFVLAL